MKIAINQNARSLRPNWGLIIILTLISLVNVLAQPGWSVQVSETTNELQDVFFLNENEGYVVGHNGTILKTSDGGTNWITLNSGVSDDLYSTWFISPSYGWASGDNNVILKTSDSGASWHLFNSGLLNGSTLTDIQFINDSVGWAVGYTYDFPAIGRIYKTTNQGNLWFLQPYPGIEGFFLSSSFINTDEGWISGAFYGVLHTSDGGSTWINLLGQSSYCVQFIDANHGWSCTEGRMVVYTTNGGLNWMTSNSGISLLWHFYFINTNVGWAVGTPSDSVAKTIDGGVNWYRVPTGIAGKPFKSNFFVNDSVGWIVGYDGIILKTTSGGEILTNVYYDSDIPEYFSLYQNYPNPFNPTTTIKYQLGNDGYVSLKVFNTLGEEVAELVNEFKRAGSYDLTFNAENLPSGMYVYKLTSGNYVESKKMIMMK